MFILVLFGYKQNRIFTIDCLSATLIDSILENSIKDILKILQDKSDKHIKEISNLEKNNVKIEKKLDELQQKFKEREEQKNNQQANENNTENLESVENRKKEEEKQNSSSQRQKQQTTQKKGDKNQQEEIVVDPLELQKQEILKEQELTNQQTEKYKDKVSKIEELKKKFSGNILENRLDKSGKQCNFVVELVDSAGERKFVKTKGHLIANSYLADKNTYNLALVKQAKQENEEDEVEMLTFDGYPLRTIEEDLIAIDEQNLLLQQQKDNKGKKGKKGK